MTRVSLDELTASERTAIGPTLVTGIRATEEPWDPEFVVDQVGSIEVPIRRITEGNYIGSAEETMSVAAYYEQIRQPLPTTGIPYLAELSYDEHFPSLARRLVDAPALPGETFGSRVMYFGRGVNSQIHFHPTGSAMLFALHGRKVVRLYAPDQTPHLAKVRGRNFSGVQVSSVGELTNEHDADRFPEFAGAEFVDFTVSPGDVLFIPIYWWHGIQNLDEISLTAVYFWSQDWRYTWRDFAPRQLPPPGMRVDYALDVARRHVVKPARRLWASVRR